MYFHSQFEQLLEVGLRNTQICDAGSDGEIAQALPNVEELDISSNLIPSWQEVARITQQLPKLTLLNLR